MSGSAVLVGRRECEVLKEDEGGRKKPFFSSYRPQAAVESCKQDVSQAFIRTGTVTVEVKLPEEASWCPTVTQRSLLGSKKRLLVVAATG